MKRPKFQEYRLSLLLVIALLMLLPARVNAAMSFMPPPAPAPTPDLVITPGPMKSPMRIASSGPGRFVATDYQANTVYEVDAAKPDEPVALFKMRGHPLSVETDGRLLMVGNDSVGAVEIYRRDGKKLKTFTDGGEIQPSDIAYDNRRRLLFVADSLNKEIKVFSRGGKLVSTFGSSAPLFDPKGLTIDARTQQVFVSDYGDPRVGVDASINIFDYRGKLVKRIIGKFSRPQGVAVDAVNLYVVDAMLGQILVFDRATHAAKAPLGSFGVNVGQLLLPLDLTRDATTGKLFVTNNRMGRVAVFPPSNP